MKLKGLFHFAQSPMHKKIANNNFTMKVSAFTWTYPQESCPVSLVYCPDSLGSEISTWSAIASSPYPPHPRDEEASQASFY